MVPRSPAYRRRVKDFTIETRYESFFQPAPMEGPLGQLLLWLHYIEISRVAQQTVAFARVVPLWVSRTFHREVLPQPPA